MREAKPNVKSFCYYIYAPYKEKEVSESQTIHKSMSTPYLTRRQIISYPLVTTLDGFALKNMLEEVQKIIIIYGFSKRLFSSDGIRFVHRFQSMDKPIT